MFQFGDGDIEFPAQPILQAAEDLALILERVCFGKMNFERQQANGIARENNKKKLNSLQELKPQPCAS